MAVQQCRIDIRKSVLLFIPTQHYGALASKYLLESSCIFAIFPIVNDHSMIHRCDAISTEERINNNSVCRLMAAVGNDFLFSPFESDAIDSRAGRRVTTSAPLTAVDVL